MRTRHVVLAFAAFALTATSASAFDFHGYFRDGMAFNSKGGGQVCFSLPGTDFKSRLGNECDHYWELSLSDTIYKDAASGIEAKAEIMPAYGLKTTDPYGARDLNSVPANDRPIGYGNGSLYTQQAWGGIKIPSLAGGATIWAGQRYFRRHNVESADWFYWNPWQGNGAAGIEDIDLGFGKVALTLGRLEAITRQVPNTAPPPATVTAVIDVTKATYMVPEVRFYGIPVNPGGALEIGVDLAIAYDQSNALGAGRTGLSPWFTVEHFQDKFLGGFNKLTFQYASGAFATMSNGVNSGANSDPKQWRVIEQLAFFPIPEFSGQFFVTYQDKDAGAGAGTKTFSGEFRPSYHVSDSFKLQGDVMYQSLSVKGSSDSAATLLKVTVAPTLVAGRGFFARPELRVFATYGVWNDSAVTLAGTGGIANGAFGTDKNGLTFGAQIEAWF